MMRFTQLLAVAARRSVTSTKPGKSVLLAAALSPKRKPLSPVSVTKLMRPSGSGKSAPSSFLLKDKKKVATAKADVVQQQQQKKAAKVGGGRGKGKKASSLFLRFYYALKKNGCVKGKRRMQKAGELWRTTKKVEDFKKRVEVATRLAMKGKTSKGRKLLKKKAATQTKNKKSTKGVKKAYRRVAKKKTVVSTVPPLP